MPAATLAGMQDLLELLFELITLKSRKRGPLVVVAVKEGSAIRLTLENRGKRTIAFAAVQAHDVGGTRHFPQSALAARTPIASGTKLALRLSTAELRSQGALSLAVLDTTGTAWPVEGFDAGMLESDA